MTTPQTNEATERLCLALDMHEERTIMETVEKLKGLVGYFKLNSAFTLFGPPLVRAILGGGGKIFLDLKLHDIPNTLAGYGEAVTHLGVQIVTVHIEGGTTMMRELVRSADATSRKLGKARPKFVGVSILTSIDQATLNSELNVSGSLQSEVLRRGRLAAEAGLDGMVCSAAELSVVKPHLPPSFFYVTPGVRARVTEGDDHKRTASYSDAIQAGADLLVVGRSILSAADPVSALRELQRALASTT